MNTAAPLVATYTIAVDSDPHAAAAMLAGEQSAGTFTKVHGDSPALQAQFGATVESVEPTGRTRVAARSYDRTDQTTTMPEYVVRVSYPAGNIGASASHLMTVVAGNLFDLRVLGGVRLEHIEVPQTIAETFQLPVPHGIAGSRASMKRSSGALIGTIVKPSIGLDNRQIADLVEVLGAARLDLVKDDELNPDLPHAPLDERITLVQDVIDRLDRPGIQYAYNVTGTIDHMKRSVDLIAERGGTTAMVVVPWVGLEAFAELRRHTPLVLQAHRAGSGALDRSSDVGISFGAYATILRLLGADQVHVGGIRSKFWEHTDHIVRSVNALTRTDVAAEPSLPVLSSAQTVLTAEQTVEALKSEDLLVLAGGGIHGHPDGPAAGVRSMRLAWEAALSGTPLAQAASTDPALATAIKHFAENS